MRHLPNIICLLRIVLVWPLIHSLRAGDYDNTLWIFAVAAVSDGLDGYLAKRFGWTSHLGAVLDPVADKLLLVSLFLLATWLGLIPRWLTVLAVMRDVMIGSGALVYLLAFGPLNGRPMWISKLNTLLQLSFVLAVIAAAAWRNVPRPLVVAAGAATFVTTVVSGIDYVLTYAREAIRATRVAPRAAR